LRSAKLKYSCYEFELNAQNTGFEHVGVVMLKSISLSLMFFLAMGIWVAAYGTLPA